MTASIVVEPHHSDVSEPRQRFVQCASPAGLHRIAYTDWGDPANPRVLLCVQGLTRSGRDFDRVARALSGEYRVVCPDVAGRGLSDWLADSRSINYSAPQYVSDMVTLIARLNVETVDWFGTSMGGLIWHGAGRTANTPIHAAQRCRAAYRAGGGAAHRRPKSRTRRARRFSGTRWRRSKRRCWSCAGKTQIFCRVKPCSKMVEKGQAVTSV